MAFAIIFVVIIAILAWTNTISSISPKKPSKPSNSNISVVSKDTDLHFKIKVSKCDSSNASTLIMERRSVENFKHNPAQATYIGATVGGVHMGDWKVEDAYTSREVIGVSNKYNLWYKVQEGNKSTRKIVEEVQLTDELVDKAKKIPPVCKYLKGDTLILKNEDTEISKMAAKKLSSAVTTADFYNLSSIISEEKSLSEDEMTAVYNFLCGK